MRWAVLLLCALGPAAFRGGRTGEEALVLAEPLAATIAPREGVVAFARPHSLVLPTCQRPHVIAHRGGESVQLAWLLWHLLAPCF